MYYYNLYIIQLLITIPIQQKGRDTRRIPEHEDKLLILLILKQIAMILLFILGCIILIATCWLLADFIVDMKHHVYTSKDVLSVAYMIAVIVFVATALIIIYCYTEQIDILAKGIDDEVKHLANLMNSNWC